MKVKAIVEIAKDGTFSCSCSQKFDDFELLGFGGSAEEAKNDFLLCYEEMKELGVCEVDLTFSFVYDLTTEEKKFRKELEHSLRQSIEISKRVKRTGSTKGLKTLDEIL